MNKVILMGRLTRDPEVRQTTTGINVTRFSIAVERRFAREGQQNVDFLNCVAWRQTGDFVGRYFSKGSMIAVVGSVQTRTWEGQDGKKNYATEISVDEAYFTGSKGETGTATATNVETRISQPASQEEPKQFEDFDMSFGPANDSEDDLPF